MASAWSSSRIEVLDGSTETVDYELCPPTALPTLDLSLSVKSRFLSRRALARLNAVVRQRKVIGIVGFAGVACYFLALLLPAKTGQTLGVLSAVCYVPTVLSGFSLLRYEVVRLIPKTYDFWFCSFINVTTFVVLTMITGDARGFAIVTAGLGIQNNILIDASIRAVKLWVVFNVCGTLCFAVTWITVSLDLLDGMQHHALLRIRSHELSAKGYATAGLVTLTALVARNVYRKRHVFRTHANASIVECVVYRTDLKYVVRSSTASQQVQSAARSPPRRMNKLEHMKTMRYVRQIKALSARDTLLRVACVQQTASASQQASVLFHWFGVASAIVTGASSMTVMFTFETNAELDATDVSGKLALCLTALYCGVFALHFQRQVLKALCTSFNFVFLSVQVTVVIVSLCDFMEWRDSSYDLAAWWLWVHWLLTLDAVTPVMRTKLGLRQKRFPVALLAVFVAVSTLFIWKLLVSDAMNPMYDRVLLTTTVFGHTLELQLIPLFVNCLGMVILLSIRLLWRAVHNDFDVLLVLDGAVEYDNYLVTAKCRRSRRMGSIVPATAQLERIESNHEPRVLESSVSRTAEWCEENVVG